MTLSETKPTADYFAVYNRSSPKDQPRFMGHVHTRSRHRVTPATADHVCRGLLMASELAEMNAEVCHE